MAAPASKGDENYLAKPPGPCCALGTIHKGSPRGKMETIVETPTYVATPEQPNGHVVLYFPDVWGMSSNAQLLMDGFADAGFLTLGMDYFRGVRDLKNSRLVSLAVENFQEAPQLIWLTNS